MVRKDLEKCMPSVSEGRSWQDLKLSMKSTMWTMSLFLILSGDLPGHFKIERVKQSLPTAMVDKQSCELNICCPVCHDYLVAERRNAITAHVHVCHVCVNICKHVHENPYMYICKE